MAEDRGFAWVRRGFAKPFVSGSIPAPVSTYNVGKKIGQHMRRVFDANHSKSKYRTFISGIMQGAYSGRPLHREQIHSFRELSGRYQAVILDLKETRRKLESANAKLETQGKELSKLKRSKV